MDRPSCARAELDRIDEVVQFWAAENPDVDVPLKTLTLCLRAAGRELERMVRDEMAALDLEVWEGEMLMALRRTPALCRSAGELCREAGVTSGAITNRLSRLEARGWVSRSVDPSDRRQVLVTLTGPGRQHADRLVAAKNDAEQRFFSGVPRRTVERLTGDLRDLLASLADRTPAQQPSTP